MTLVLSPTSAPLGTVAELLSPTRPNLGAQAVELEGSAFDHVIKTLADLPAPVGGIIDLTSGSWALKNSIDLGANYLRIAAGQNVYLQGMGTSKIITSTAAAAIVVNGIFGAYNLHVINATNDYAVVISGSLFTHLRDCHLTSDLSAVAVLSTTRKAVLDDCRLEGTTAGAIELNAAATTFLKVSGGRWQGPNGLAIAGNCQDISLNQVEVEVTNAGIIRTAGAQLSCRIVNCTLSAADTCIVWTAANLPSQGLLVVGNDLAFGVAPYSGHTQASPLANYKANGYPGGLFPETAIVP